MGAEQTGAPAERVVRVLPDVAGLDKAFDYLVPAAMADRVRVGTLVRVALHGRRVGAWVLEVDVDPPEGVVLKPIAKVTGWGPTAELVELSRWAAWRWAGRRRAFVRAASPPGAVVELPRPPGAAAVAPTPVRTPAGALAEGALDVGGVQVLRLPPATDPFDVVLAAALVGPTLVVAPSVALAAELGARLRRTGVPAAVVPRGWAQARRGGTCVLGARAAAWAPAPGMAAAVVLDEHDEVHQEERSPTWHARDVVIERARRAGVPVLLCSPCPSLEALGAGPLHALDRAAERDGWPVVDVLDRRDDDPARAGLISERLTDLLRSEQRVVCVLNRKGRARLLACVGCGELGRCEACQAAVAQSSDGDLVCHRCGTRRPVVCLQCRRSSFKNLRAGVSRVREELEALAGRPVAEVTGDAQDAVPAGPSLLVGTEAVLHRAGRADAVVFLDLDQELLAPRYRAAEEALALLVRAARLVGGRRGGGRLVVQTRLSGHEVIEAALRGDPSVVAEREAARREVLRYPPAVAMAEVASTGAAELVTALGRPLGVEVLGPTDGSWLLRAPDHQVLCDALAATARPSARLRLAVDPMRL